MEKKKLFIFIGSGLLLYFVSTGFSFAAFSYLNRAPTFEEVKSPTVKESGFKFDESLPKTEECPLNGAMYSKPQRQWWEKHRPAGVMIENHQEARPQSGLSQADIIYEAVAEGGITRFLAIFYCQDTEMLGPIRSARTYFLDFISEYGDKPLYVHVGGANTPGPANALGQIVDYGWVGKNDLNQFSIGFPTFWRDYERMGRVVATEHTMYSTTTKLWEMAEKRGLGEKDEKERLWDEKFEKWSFKEDLPKIERPEAAAAEFSFWLGYEQYKVKWEYDKSLNSYKRFNGGEPHLDKNDNSQLTAKTVILVFTRETNANDGYENNAHLLYGTKGKGKATILLDGKIVEGEWRKQDRLGRMKFFDNKGKEVSLNKGTIWIEILPIGTSPKYD